MKKCKLYNLGLTCLLALGMFVVSAASVSAYPTQAEVDRAEELYELGYSYQQVLDQLEEEFRGDDGLFDTGGIDGRLVDGSIAPNGILAATHTHDYKETSRTEATCTEKGKITYTCWECKKTKTESIPKLDHSFEEVEGSMKPGTCLEEGSVTQKCTMCGLEKKLTLAKGDHAYTVGQEIAATCIEKGKTEHICSICGDVKIEETDYADHVYESGEGVEPTCTEDGKNVVVCSVCGDTKEEVIAATGHTWESEYTMDIAATCTTDGSQSHHCQACDKTDEAVVVPATGHSYVTVTDKEATFWTNGTLRHECENCGEISSYEVILATGGIYRYIIIGIGVVALIGVAIAVTVICKKKREK